MAGEVKLVITADAQAAVAGVQRVVQAVGTDLPAAAAAATQTSAATTAAVTKLGETGALSAAQLAQSMRYLPKQFDDAFRSLSAGQAPMAVLFQQGSQLKDMFGGYAGAAKAVATLITPLTVLAAAVALVGYNWYQGVQQSKEFANALALSGNAAGLTEGQFNHLVSTLADGGRVGAGAVRAMMQELVAGGQLSGEAYTAAGRAAIALSKLNGQSAADNAKAFAGMRDDVSAWAEKANKSYAFLTGEQYTQVMALQASGQAGEAARMVLDALATTMENRTAPALGTLGRALADTSKGWGNFWDAAQGTGRTDTVDDKIARLKAHLAAAPGATAGDRWYGADGQQVAGRSAAAASLQAWEQDKSDKEAKAAADAAITAKNQEDILHASRAFTDSLLAIDTARNSALLASQQAGLEARRAALDKAHRNYLLDDQGLQAGLDDIERQRLANEQASAAKSVAIEAGRTVKTEQETNARTAAVLAAGARETAIAAQRAKLEEDITQRKAQQRDDFHAKYITQVNQEIVASQRLYEAEQERAEAEVQQRVQAARQFTKGQADTNLQSAAELIQDPGARGQALIELQRRRLAEQLADFRRYGVDVTAAQALADEAIVLAQQKLAEDLKPTWQKNLEAWQDNNRLMKDSWNTMMDGVLKNGEDAFVQLAKTGKLSVKGLVDAALDEMLRLEFRKFIGGLGGTGGGLGGLFGSLAGLFTGNPLAGGTGFGDYNAVAELAGARAGGGPVAAGSTYLVGERGPELLRMGSQGGSVIPNHAIAAASGGGGAVSLSMPTTIHIDARSDQGQIAQLVGGAIAESQRNMMAALRARGIV